MTYDLDADVNRHRDRVSNYLSRMVAILNNRGVLHDLSKLRPPEREIFEKYTPLLKEYEFGSDEYKAALEGMGEGLAHHYSVNKHHIEHWTNGISDMSLIDLIEMVCDWMAAADARGAELNWDYMRERWNISLELENILRNTVLELK